MEILGHSQIELTMDTYGRLMPTAQREAAHLMARVLCTACPQTLGSENGASICPSDLRYDARACPPALRKALVLLQVPEPCPRVRPRRTAARKQRRRGLRRQRRRVGDGPGGEHAGGRRVPRLVARRHEDRLPHQRLPRQLTAGAPVRGRSTATEEGKAADGNANPAGAVPQEEGVRAGDRRQRVLAGSALACAALLAVLSGWGWVVVRRGGEWAGWVSGGVDDVLFALALFVPAGAALLGAAAWLAGRRREGGAAAEWGRGGALVAFFFAALWRGPAVLPGRLWWTWVADGWAARLEAWASVGGLVAAALGVWLDRRARPSDVASYRGLVVILLALLLGCWMLGLAFSGM